MKVLKRRTLTSEECMFLCESLGHDWKEVLNIIYNKGQNGTGEVEIIVEVEGELVK